jgi:aspartyl-tRNA(Asn)/glutamyl-tRNA(Gln) amidotransferase subunit A
MNRRLTAVGFTGQWNLAGLPALALPCGFGSTTLPLSMQIVGKPFAEATVLKAGDAYQQLTDWHLRVPPIAAPVAA